MDKLAALFARRGRVDALEISDDFQKHLANRAVYRKHDVTLTEILEIHANLPKYFLNVGVHRAPIIMVGPTLAGRFLCVPLEPGGQKGVWRPVTAFEANTHHKMRYQEEGQ